MQKIKPCLWFDGQAEEATTFYTSIFKHSIKMKIVRAFSFSSAAANNSTGNSASALTGLVWAPS